MHPKFQLDWDAISVDTKIKIPKQRRKTFTSNTLSWHRHVCKTIRQVGFKLVTPASFLPNSLTIHVSDMHTLEKKVYQEITQ